MGRRHVQLRTDPRKYAAIAFFLVFLTVQLLVPLIALASPRPARFAWQMYAGIRTQADIVIVYADGRELPADPSAYLGSHRLEIDLSTFLPAHICDVDRDVAAVRIEPWFDETVTVISCDS